MKKYVSLLLCAVLLVSLSACSPAARTPVEGITGIGVYTDFIRNIDSGELVKLYYNYDSWYEFCASTSTRIQFKQTSAGKRELVYRERDLFVFWHYPPYDYYDGDTYYYKYKDEWYTDSFTKFDRVKQGDFIGIRDNFFVGNSVLSDVVYKSGNGYESQAVVQTPNKSVYYSVLGKMDKDFIFSNISIRKYQYDEEKGTYKKVAMFFYRYSNVNKVEKIERPDDLTLADI